MPKCNLCGYEKLSDEFGRCGDGISKACLLCRAEIDRQRGRYKRGTASDLETERDRRERERTIRDLIRRYVAVRFEPGLSRDVAYESLSLALRKHGFPVTDDGRQWHWRETLQDVTSWPIVRAWRDPEDRQADPRRVVRANAEYPITDVVEVEG
jgi:hypothetical protein